MFGSAGGGQAGGAGGGRIWLNVTDTFLLDGLLTASGENGKSSGGQAGGGGSGGSVWLHCDTITGDGYVITNNAGKDVDNECFFLLDFNSYIMFICRLWNDLDPWRKWLQIQ